MIGRENLLFYGNDLSQVLQANLKGAKNDVDQIPEDQFIHSSDEDIVEHVYSRREVIPIELHEDRKVMETQETKVDVRHDFNRAIFDKSKPCMVAGLRITVTVPFSGDANLWRCQPSTYTLNPPRGNIRAKHNDEGGYLEIVLERPSDTLGAGEEIKREIESTLSNIRGVLEEHKEQRGRPQPATTWTYSTVCRKPSRASRKARRSRQGPEYPVTKETRRTGSGCAAYKTKVDKTASFRTNQASGAWNSKRGLRAYLERDPP